MIISKNSNYDVSKIKVSLTPKSGYSFVLEEPGKYIFLNKKNGNYFERIEVLDSKANFIDIKNDSI